jgi:hypothetical protein
LIAVLELDDVVIGGGNAKKLKKLRTDVERATTTTRSSGDFDFGKNRAKLRSEPQPRSPVQRGRSQAEQV